SGAATHSCARIRGLRSAKGSYIVKCVLCAFSCVPFDRNIIGGSGRKTCHSEAIRYGIPLEVVRLTGAEVATHPVAAVCAKCVALRDRYLTVRALRETRCCSKSELTFRDRSRRRGVILCVWGAAVQAVLSGNIT